MATTIIEKVLPSNLQFLNSKNEVYTLEIGNRTKSVQTYTATSHSDSTTTFNFNTPSSKVVMGRRLILQTQITVVAAGGSFGANFAPRQWGVMAGCRAVDLTINGGKSHSNPSELLPVFGRFHTSPDHRARFMSGCPSMPDIGEMAAQLAYEYYDGPNTAIQGVVWDQTANGGAGGAIANTVINRLSYPNTNSPFSNDLRGNGEPSRAWRGYFTEDTAGTRIYNLYTPVFCSPLSWNSSSDGLGNVSKVELRLDWESQLLTTMFNDLAGTGRNSATAGNLTIDFDVKPLLHVEYSDPIVDIPPALAFDHVELQTDRTQVGSAAVNAATQFTARNTTQFMDIVPQCVYIFVRERVSQMNIGRSAVYAGCRVLKLRYDNIEYTYTEDQMNTLWQQSVNNGLDLAWPLWKHTAVSGQQKAKVGSIICLQFGKDIPLPAGVFPGSPKKSSLSVEFTGVNNYSVNLDLDLYTVLSYNSRYIIRENAAQVVIGLTPDEQAQLEGTPMSEAEAQNPHDIVGGGFGKWKKFAHKIGSVASAIYKNRDAIEGAYNQGKDAYQQGKDIIGTIRSVQRTAPDAMQGGLLIGGTMVGGGVRSRFM